MPPVTIRPLSAVLLDLPNTIRDPEFKKNVGNPWFLQHVSQYLYSKWDDPNTIDIVRNVRNEVLVLQKDPKYKDIPLVAEVTSSKSSVISSIEASSRYLCNKNLKQDPRGLERLKSVVWRDGFRNKTFTVPLYADFITAAANWKRSKILVFGTTDTTADEQKIY
ncbi:enolase-phosphatase E1-like protein, partial [Leptotrombidium deliense]